MSFKLKLEQFFTEQLWQHLIVFSFLFASAWIFTKYAEAAMFYIAHYFVRKNFDKQYHCGTTATCLVTTSAVLFLGVSTVLPVSISLLSTVPVCWAVSWVGFIVQDRLDLIEINKKLRQAQERTPIEELVARCRKHNYSELKTQMAIKFFIDNEKPKAVWLWLCEMQQNPIEWDSVKKIKYRMKKELF